MEHGASSSPLIKRLVALGVVRRDTLAQAEQELGPSHAVLVARLAEREEVDAARLTGAVAREFGLPLLDLDRLAEVAPPATGIDHDFLARLDIAERRAPQDGRMRLRLPNRRKVDLRMNTLPTLCGERVVVRILNSGAALPSLDKLGMTARQQRHFLAALDRPRGMILVTGPTGSGKTVTLYAALERLNVQERNISAVEDPCETQLAGINQVNVNRTAGLTFASALRAVLRQDADVIMVGEVRDAETAAIAVRAAQTGHLVLSTLHTEDAPASLTRLRDLEVAPYAAASVHLILAQRLARRLCPEYRQDYLPDDAALRGQGVGEDILPAGTRLYRPGAGGAPAVTASTDTAAAWGCSRSCRFLRRCGN